LTKEVLARDYRITYYKPSDLLPAIRSVSDGPRKPAGHKKMIIPPKGSTAFHPTQTISSAPPSPDNTSQTIVQPKVPQLQIKEEVKVPNIVIWNVEDKNLGTVQIANKALTPLLSSKLRPPPAALRPPEPELKNLDQIANKQVGTLLSPKPEIPSAALQPPDPELKNIGRTLSDLRIAQANVPALNPKLAVHPGASPGWSMGSDAGSAGPTVQDQGASGK
jgi:hypothetical protein